MLLRWLAARVFVLAEPTVPSYPKGRKAAGGAAAAGRGTQISLGFRGLGFWV